MGYQYKYTLLNNQQHGTFIPYQKQKKTKFPLIYCLITNMYLSYACVLKKKSFI